MTRKLIYRKIPTYGFTKKRRKILAVPCLSIDMFVLHVVYIQSYLALCLLAFFTHILFKHALTYTYWLAQQKEWRETQSTTKRFFFIDLSTCLCNLRSSCHHSINEEEKQTLVSYLGFMLIVSLKTILFII
jgi:hypothetical protein